MSRFTHSLVGVAIFCLLIVHTCSPNAKELPQPLPEQGHSGQRFITIDFDNVDIQLFIKYISELTGKNFVVDKSVRGNVTILSPTKISEDEAYKVFESVLEVHGFTTVESGSVIKILPMARARSQNIEMLEPGAKATAEDKIVTQLVRLKYTSPDEMKKVLAPLVSQTSVLISHSASGMLIITETMSNIKKLLGIIKELDVESREDELAFVPLQNASADAIAKIVTSVYQKGGRAQRTRAIGSSTDEITVVPYDRVNALIVLANSTDIGRVKSLISMLDTEVQRAEGNIHVYYLQNATAEELAKVLNDLPQNQQEQPGVNRGKAAAISKDVKVWADEETNSLVITASKDEYTVLEDVIKQLDIPRRMVYLEALIMEVSADKSFDLGVEWIVGGTDGNGQVVSGFSGTGSTLPDAINATTPSLASGFTLGVLNQGGIRIGNFTFANLGAVINAFKSDSDVNVISTPQLLTMDNKKAEISVGETVPFISRQDNTSGDTTGLVFTTFDYKDVATKLSITPHINQSDILRLEINTEVTRLKENGNTDTPTTFKRTADTTVILNDRSTVVIGGIIGHDATETNTKVPILGDIPLLGWLFRTHSTLNNKTNMFIFITPHIVRNPANIAAVTLKKEDEMGTVLPAMQNALHNAGNPENAMNLSRTGYEKLQAGDIRTAKEYFDEALRIDPANPFALMNMGVVYEREGKPKQALEMYRAVVAGKTEAVADGTGKPSNAGVSLKKLAQDSIDRIMKTNGIH